MLGRICPDKEDMLARVALCAELAKEAGCYDAPYPFPTGHTAYACLSGKNVSPAYPLYDDTWGEVVLLSGLPGTGKDTWIGSHCPGLPMISLDEIRKELKMPPTQNQGGVVEAGRGAGGGDLPYAGENDASRAPRGPPGGVVLRMREAEYRVSTKTLTRRSLRMLQVAQTDRDGIVDL